MSTLKQNLVTAASCYAAKPTEQTASKLGNLSALYQHELEGKEAKNEPLVLEDLMPLALLLELYPASRGPLMDRFISKRLGTCPESSRECALIHYMAWLILRDKKEYQYATKRMLNKIVKDPVIHQRMQDFTALEKRLMLEIGPYRQVG